MICQIWGLGLWLTQRLQGFPQAPNAYRRHSTPNHHRLVYARCRTAWLHVNPIPRYISLARMYSSYHGIACRTLFLASRPQTRVISCQRTTTIGWDRTDVFGAESLGSSSSCPSSTGYALIFQSLSTIFYIVLLTRGRLQHVQPPKIILIIFKISTHTYTPWILGLQIYFSSCTECIFCSKPYSARSHKKPVVRASEVSHTPCKYKFRRTPPSHSCLLYATVGFKAKSQ